MACIVVPVLEDGVVRERAQHLERALAVARLLEGLLRLDEPILFDEPVAVRQVDLRSEVLVLLDQLERLLPLMIGRVQRQHAVDVAELEEDLLCVGHGGRLVGGGLLEVGQARAQLGLLRSLQASGHLGDLIDPPLLAQDVDRFEGLARRKVGLVGHREVIRVLRPLGLPSDQLLRVLRGRVVCVLAGLVPLAQVGEHVDGALDAVGLAVEAGGFLQFALVSEHRRDQHLVVVARLPPLRLYPVDEVHVPCVPQA